MSARRMGAIEIRVRGRVQGVGFRPTVFRIATELGLDGEVENDAQGVLIRATGSEARIAELVARLERDRPPLARIESVETRRIELEIEPGFRIAKSRPGRARTEIAPDAVVCDACVSEIFDPESRRHRYPFTTCTHCGPRLSIVQGIPYDRSRTTMARFPLCPLCRDEYDSPGDRRFHAEPTACAACGPRLALEPFLGQKTAPSFALDAAAAARELLDAGAILAIKGLGGFQLACDATRSEAVERLRARKRRDAKPFALMARDLEMVRRYASLDDVEIAALGGAAAPIVLLRADGPGKLPEAVAPGLGTLGFMLPTTPLHALLLERARGPLVMTSGNLADEPQAIEDADARARLGSIADFALVHDREIANRVDDSVVRVMGGVARVLRRARGHAPSPIRLPPGFERAPPLLAYGGDLKATFCLVSDGRAVLSQHQGDLDDLATRRDYEKNLRLYADLFTHTPELVVHDRHPDYASSALARARGLPTFEVQHHHAHIAACLAENGRPLDAAAVLGIALDGLGYGDEGELWGGELLLADYRAARRLARLKPVALIGGDRAAREPWRNLYAHVVSSFGREALHSAELAGIESLQRLREKPLGVLDDLIRAGLAPPTSSCGRLFDAVAAAAGVVFDRQAWEGEAGARLEALASRAPDEPHVHPFAIERAPSGLLELAPEPMWRALVEDLAARTPSPVIAARFHRGLARGLAALATRLAGDAGFDTVALSGGCFQNRVLVELTITELQRSGFGVLTHREVPPNDGGISLGQAVVAAASRLEP